MINRLLKSNFLIASPIVKDYIWRMIYRWYIGALVAMISLFVVDQQQGNVPNQEISVSFINQENNDQAREVALQAVIVKLQSLGILDIEINQQVDGALTISYYSTLSMLHIKEQLSQQVAAVVTYSDTKDVDPINGYSIDIAEIHADSNGAAGMNDVCLLELKQDFSRGCDVQLSSILRNTTEELFSHNIPLASAIYGDTSFAIARSLLQTPEVRAGPTV